jgi:hypothetical protein
MASLTREQIEKVISELLEIAIDAEMVRIHDGIPIHYHTGEPITPREYIVSGRFEYHQQEGPCVEG